ncbi:MAG: hypothetical protein RJA07_198 [Bacteroidota bacterium]|jgi:hypothetical protein
MKKIILFIVALFFASQIKAQVNLVPNPSFELYDTCPDNLGEVYHAKYWSSFGGSSDYFNSCSIANGKIAYTPSNLFGYQIASSGNAYCGFISFLYSSPYIDLKEFIGCQLINSLVVGQKYFVSFKISLSDSSVYATGKIGVSFTNYKYSALTSIPIDSQSKITSKSIILDKNNWTQITGSFIADSAYTYLAIGNFYTDSHSNIVRLNNDTFSIFSEAYYYIDDICVSTDSTYAYNYIYTDVQNIVENPKTKIYPNPIVDNFSIYFSSPTNYIQLINILGQQIFWEKVEPNIASYSKDISTLPNGIYFLKVNSINKTETIKLIKQ